MPSAFKILLREIDRKKKHTSTRFIYCIKNMLDKEKKILLFVPCLLFRGSMSKDSIILYYWRSSSPITFFSLFIILWLICVSSVPRILLKPIKKTRVKNHYCFFFLGIRVCMKLVHSVLVLCLFFSLSFSCSSFLLHTHIPQWEQL
jgi:hypothetical protein